VFFFEMSESVPCGLEHYNFKWRILREITNSNPIIRKLNSGKDRPEIKTLRKLFFYTLSGHKDSKAH
jgi:hypothetical protein